VIDKYREGVEDMLKREFPDDELRDDWKIMLERKRRMFPDNKRIIRSYELSKTPDGYHLTVASTIPSELKG